MVTIKVWNKVNFNDHYFMYMFWIFQFWGLFGVMYEMIFFQMSSEHFP